MVRILDAYLADIGREPLLTREEEVELARRARLGDGAARRRLATANLRFVVSVARGYQGRGVPFADLVNEGNLGLLRAAERFDETRGVRFISYAHWWVRRAIAEAIRRDRGRARDGDRRPPPVSLDEPLAGNPDGTLQDVLPDRRSAQPGDGLHREGLRLALEASLSDLPPREREVVRRYFGVDLDRCDSLRRIARDMGISPERVRQLRERALSRLRARARQHRLDRFRGRGPEGLRRVRPD